MLARRFARRLGFSVEHDQLVPADTSQQRVDVAPEGPRPAGVVLGHMIHCDRCGLEESPGRGIRIGRGFYCLACAIERLS